MVVARTENVVLIPDVREQFEDYQLQQQELILSTIRRGLPNSKPLKCLSHLGPYQFCMVTKNVRLVHLFHRGRRILIAVGTRKETDLLARKGPPKIDKLLPVSELEEIVAAAKSARQASETIEVSSEPVKASAVQSETVENHFEWVGQLVKCVSGELEPYIETVAGAAAIDNQQTAADVVQLAQRTSEIELNVFNVSVASEETSSQLQDLVEQVDADRTTSREQNQVLKAAIEKNSNQLKLLAESVAAFRHEANLCEEEHRERDASQARAFSAALNEIHENFAKKSEVDAIRSEQSDAQRQWQIRLDAAQHDARDFRMAFEKDKRGFATRDDLQSLEQRVAAERAADSQQHDAEAKANAQHTLAIENSMNDQGVTIQEVADVVAELEHEFTTLKQALQDERDARNRPGFARRGWYAVSGYVRRFAQQQSERSRSSSRIAP